MMVMGTYANIYALNTSPKPLTDSDIAIKSMQEKYEQVMEKGKSYSPRNFFIKLIFL